MPYCPHCGNQLTGSESHCPACGQPVRFPATALRASPARTPASLPLGEYFKTGWGLFMQYPGGFVGFCLLISRHPGGLARHSLLWAQWRRLAVSTPLFMGNFIVSAKLLQGQTPEFRDFFAGFQYFLPLLLLSLVAGLFIGIGTILLIIPGVYLAVAYLFASYLVVDRRLDFWPAMELSRLTVNPRWFGYFAFVLLLALLNLAGAIALGVGLLVTIPLSFCAVTVAYADLFGLQSDYCSRGPEVKNSLQAQPMAVTEPSAQAPALWEVAVALPLAHTLTYRLPPALAAAAQVGSLVRVPVGRRQVTGYLLGPTREAPPGTLRDIQEVLDPIPRFGPELVPLFRWVADYYQYPLGEALSFIIPGGAPAAKPRRELWACPVDPPEAEPVPQSAWGPSPGRSLTYLEEAGPTPVKDLQPRFPACRDSLRRLAARGLIGLEDRTRLRTHEDDAPLSLRRARPHPGARPGTRPWRTSSPGLTRGEFTPFLLHGVTASGKTEVYLNAAAHALARGRQVLVLVPEIALTHPVAQAFRRRFGSRVALLHSGLSEAFRVDQWRRIMVGEVDIVVGARSAVFAPLPRLGLVVVDEEHDPSYKQEGGLLYQARDVALYRGKLAGAAVVLVSATPQVTSCYYGPGRQISLSQTRPPGHSPDPARDPAGGLADPAGR